MRKSNDYFDNNYCYNFNCWIKAQTIKLYKEEYEYQIKLNETLKSQITKLERK
jgi:hypothetical protein